MTDKEEKRLQYLEFLKELKLALSYTDKLSMRDILKKHDVKNNASQVLLEGGIITNNGVNGGGCRWYWNTTTEPNIAMAVELINKMSLYSKRVNSKSRKKEEEKQVIVESKRLFHFSLFWGLIKIELK